MQEPDKNKMRIMLAANSNNERDKNYILNEMSINDILYEFIKVFGSSRIPKKEVE